MRTGLGCGMQAFASVFRRVGPVEQKAPLALAQGKFHGIGHAAAVARFRNQPVDYQIDCMTLVFIEYGRIVESGKFAVNPQTRKAFGLELAESLLLRSFLSFDNRGHDDKFLAFWQGQDFGDYLVYVAGFDWPAALRAINRAQAREKDAQKIMGLGYRAHGGARISCQPLLFQGNGRGKAFYFFNIRLVHLRQELPGVCRKRFHIAALAFGINNVKGKS